MTGQVATIARQTLRESISIARRPARPLKAAAIRRWGTPKIGDLLIVSGGEVSVDADEFTRKLHQEQDVDRFRPEFDADRAELSYRRERDNYPASWDVELGTAWFLYAHVRVTRPQHVLENGASSFFFLRALERNGAGTLHSVDVSPDVGRVLSDDERAGWDLHVLPEGRGAARALTRYVDQLPPLDLFVHDSLHSYAWMRHEYRAASARLRPGALLASDDADWSYAFAEFCAEHHREPSYLFDGRKLFGAVHVG